VLRWGTLVALCLLVGGRAGQTVFTPPSSLVDFSSTLESPAGRHGFLRATADGHFAFDDGTPVRFFGINVAHDSVFRSRDDIDRMVDTFARAGLNLVRFHHIDERDGLIDYERPDTRTLRVDRLELLDYWIAQLKARGLYSYLDLLDYRTFRPADGVRNAAVLGRGAKPMALFDARLIQLQQEYATQLLGRVNRLTGLRYADEPAIVMIELFDENGLFRRREWNALPEPYRTELLTRWHAWLRARGRRPAALPNLGDEKSSLLGEALRFAAQLHTKHFRMLREHLRSLGVRVPMTAVGRYEELADLQTVAEELDFIGVNFYWDHPFWSRGNDWTLPSYFRNTNPLSLEEPLDRSFAPQLCLSRVRGKPLVVREWNYCWPNRFRAAGMIEAAAYASLHDFDALVLFDYRAAGNGLGYFDVALDPARWRLVPLAAQVFLRRALAPAKPITTISHSPAEVFRTLTASKRLTAAAWSQRVENWFGPAGSVLPLPPNGPLIASATGEIIRYPDLGFLQVNAPTIVARAGNLNRGDSVLGPFTVTGLPETGAFAALALRSNSSGTAREWLIVLTTECVNTGQKLIAETNRWQLVWPGALPILTSGRLADNWLSLSHGDRPLMKIRPSGGTLELAMRGRAWYLHCEVSGAELELADSPRSMTAVSPSGVRTKLAAEQSFRWPATTQRVEIEF